MVNPTCLRIRNVIVAYMTLINLKNEGVIKVKSSH